MDDGDLRHLVESLRRVDAWDMLERVSIDGRDILDLGEAVEVIVKEKLLTE